MDNKTIIKLTLQYNGEATHFEREFDDFVPVPEKMVLDTKYVKVQTSYLYLNTRTLHIILDRYICNSQTEYNALCVFARMFGQFKMVKSCD
jgi:hypothetical protein